MSAPLRRLNVGLKIEKYASRNLTLYRRRFCIHLNNFRQIGPRNCYWWKKCIGFIYGLKSGVYKRLDFVTFAYFRLNLISRFYSSYYVPTCTTHVLVIMERTTPNIPQCFNSFVPRSMSNSSCIQCISTDYLYRYSFFRTRTKWKQK